MIIKDMNEEEFESAAQRPYSQMVLNTIMTLGYAVEQIINIRDIAVLNELENITADVFRQARAALDENRNRVQ